MMPLMPFGLVALVFWCLEWLDALRYTITIYALCVFVIARLFVGAAVAEESGDALAEASDTRHAHQQDQQDQPGD